MILVPRFVQTPPAAGLDYGFGASATKAGLYLLPGALLGFISGPSSARLGAKFGFKFPLALGMVASAVGLVLLAKWHDRPWQVVLGITVVGAALPLAFGAMAKLVVDAVKPSETGISTGLNTVMRRSAESWEASWPRPSSRQDDPGHDRPDRLRVHDCVLDRAAISICGVATALAVTPLRRSEPAMAVETKDSQHQERKESCSTASLSPSTARP